jgi:anti-sigma B factor antagonist
VDTDAPEFRVEVGRADGSLVVAPHGELDVSTAPALTEALGGRSDGDGLVIDLRGLQFLDTTGLRLILEQEAAARKEGRSFAVVRGGQEVQRIFQIAGLERVLPFVDDVSGDP